MEEDNAENENEVLLKKKPLWDRPPLYKPSYYGKHKSRLPPTNVKKALLHYNMTEQRLLERNLHIITNQQMWTQKLHNLQKKAFIIRQLLQQEMLRARGINCATLLPHIVTEAHKYLAQSELMKLTYLGAKHLPMHGRIKLYELQKYEDEMFVKQEKQNTQLSLKKEKSSLPAISANNLAHPGITSRHNRRLNNAKNHENTVIHDTRGALMNDNERKSKTFTENVTTTVYLAHETINLKRTQTLPDIATHGEASIYTRMEKPQEEQSKQLAQHLLKKIPSLQRHAVPVPQAIEMNTKNIENQHQLKPPASNNSKSQSRRRTNPKRHLNTDGKQDLRFTELQSTLTHVHTITDKQQLPLTMQSTASCKSAPISEEDRQLIRTKYQPSNRAGLHREKIHNALQLAKSKGEQGNRKNFNY